MVIREYDSNWHDHPPMEVGWKAQFRGPAGTRFAVFRRLHSHALAWQLVPALPVRCRLGLKSVKSCAVVPDRTMQHEVFSPRSNPDIARFCVLNGVGQRFLNDPIECRFNGAGQASGNTRIDTDWQIGSFRNSFRKKTDRGNPA